MVAHACSIQLIILKANGVAHEENAYINCKQKMIHNYVGHVYSYTCKHTQIATHECSRYTYNVIQLHLYAIHSVLE